MRGFVVCGVILVFTCSRAQSQLTPPAQREIEQLIDESSDEESIGADDLERLVETRAYYERHPIDLNSATREALGALGLLTPGQIEGVIQRRATAGDYLDVLELQAVSPLTLYEVRRLAPYVTVAPAGRLAGRALLGRWRNATTFAALRTGYQRTTANTSAWTGPDLPAYARVRASAGRQLSVGLVLENDAGEGYGGPRRRAGFDHVGVHAYADELRGTVRAVALGDYGVNWGQGLVSYTGFGTGKGAQAMDVQRNPRWLIPHASAAETGYYRGAAAIAQRGRWRAMAMASRVRLDGGVDSLLGEAEGGLAFGTLRLGGLHRTPNELAGRGVNPAVSLGGAVGYEAAWGRVSAHYLEHRFAIPFRPGDRLYQALEFGGGEMRNVSVAWQTFLGPVSWFGEGALSGEGATAILSGLQCALDQRTDVSLVYRRYDPDYRVLYENVFGTTRRPENEEGIYLGLRSRLATAWTAQGFVDLYRHPYARFRASRPSLNQDVLLRVEYDRRREYALYAQFRYRGAERELSREASGALRRVEPFERTTARLQGEISLSQNLRLRTRLEYSRTRSAGTVSEGTLLYQDFLWRESASGWGATARIAIIDTDDFESRIYAYENDLLYRFRIPAYYGRGYRTYLNVRYRASTALTLEGRGAFGRRRGAEDQAEVALQVRMRL